MRRFVIGTFLVSALAVTSLHRQSVAPASVGVSTERLERLHQSMQGYVDRKEAGGIVTLIAREGKTVDVHASDSRTSRATSR